MQQQTIADDGVCQAAPLRDHTYLYFEAPGIAYTAIADSPSAGALEAAEYLEKYARGLRAAARTL